MKRGYVYIISTFLMMIVFAGCNRAIQFDRDLDRVERLLDVSPDSSWKVISAINPDEPRHIGRKARYGLLYIQAQDKNNLKIENDTLISLVVNYYAENGNVKEKFLSFFYYGKWLADRGDYVRALSNFSKAESLMESIDEASYKEKLKEQIEILYNQKQNVSGVLISQHDYLLDEIKCNAEAVKSEKNTIAIWIIIAVVLCGILFFHLYEQLQRKNADLDSYADVISELRMVLNDKKQKWGSCIENY